MPAAAPVGITEVRSLITSCRLIRSGLREAHGDIQPSRIPAVTDTFFESTKALLSITQMFRAEIEMLDRISDLLDQPGVTLERDTFEDYRNVVCKADQPAQTAKLDSPAYTRLRGHRIMVVKGFLRKLIRTHWDIVDAIRGVHSPVQHELKDFANDIERALSRIQWLFDIFVCYAHADEKRVTGFLRSLQLPLEQNRIGYWWDRKGLIIGDLYNERIKQRLELVDVGLTFISDAFFASRYITEVEIKSMLERRNAEGMVICPVLLIKPNWRRWKKQATWLHDTHAFCLRGRLTALPNKLCQLAVQLEEVMRRLSTE